jgi:diaminopimelate epimerase
MKNGFEFVKYQGCGNDFILRDETEGGRTSDRDRSELAKDLTNRNFMVGADGILFLESAEGLDASMRLFEPAGNEADMCGNGIRCVGAYLMEKLGKSAVDVLTRDGVKHIVKVGKDYAVDMGTVRWRRVDLKPYVKDRGDPSDSMLSFKVKVGAAKTVNASIVNTGEPHIVVRTNSLDSLCMSEIGDFVNKDRKRFPKGVNINFVQVTGRHTIRIRTYERGVYDETLACGTGATASASVALMRHWVVPGTVNVDTRGGRIRIRLDKDGQATMTGPAVRVFEGVLSRRA